MPANSPEDHGITNETRFIADAMLGKLAKWLRVLGYDVLYSPRLDDPELAFLARIEERILLTRDTQLVKRRGLKSILLTSDQPTQQLKQLIAAVPLPAEEREFTRCLRCNSLLEPVAKGDVAGLVPPYVFSTHSVFRRCPSCLRIYWRGSHCERMRDHLTELGISSY